ncbi:MAG: hypothetical protein HC913_02900 [Microscillaceae bacterium]|nr:hypothetical protein [Microscillaceae bacterium]
MAQNFLDKLKNAMDIQNPILEHYAPLNQEAILKILNDLETQMDGFGEKLKITRKAFNVVTEALQNIAKYASPSPDEEVNPCFVLDRQADKYQIASGNLVEASRVEALRQRLEGLNQLDWYGKQQAYKDAIRGNLKNPSRDRNSAGLGFIEMARKSEQPLQFEFVPLDYRHQYFLLKITIYK